MMNEDMKIRDAAAFMTKMEVQTEDGSQKPASDCSSGSYPAVLDSLYLNEETGEVQQEQYPDMENEEYCSDVDASLMVTETGISEYKDEQPAAVLIDPEVDKEGKCEYKEDSGSLGHEHRESLGVQLQGADGGSLGYEHGYSLASVNLAMDHEAASGRAGSETGAPTGTSPAAPPLFCHAPPKQWSNYGLCFYPTNCVKRKFDCRVRNFTGNPHEMPSKTEKFGVMFGHCKNKNGK